MIYLSFLLLCFPLSGIYFGNPLSPQLPTEGVISSKEESTQIRLGYIGDFIQISNDPINANLQLGTIGCVWNRKILVELMGGSSSFHNSMKQAGALKKLYASGLFCYGVRVQAILKRWGKFVLGASASGLLGHSRCRYETVQGQAVSHPSDQLRWKAGQAGLGIALKNEKLVPYLGLNVNTFMSQIKGMGQRTKTPVSLIAGGSLVAFAAVVIDVETRFISEQGVTLASYFAF
jgi:hypothetical protein